MGKKELLILIISYFFLTIFLLFFSYTQVDLSLTLSQPNITQTIQKMFQYIGFYNRPVATGIYLSIILGMFLLYGVTLHQAYQNRLRVKYICILIGIIMSILFFSYPAAFSYDVFNYIFTAKTVLVYHQNPYVLKPLELQGIDSMLSFMRWTHLPSAYTPVWILFTLPFYILGFGNLLLTSWMIRIIPFVFYLITIWGIWNIVKEKSQRTALGNVVLFALNPLVIIEVLVSAHNDSVMMGLSIIAIYLLIKKKKVSSIFFFAVSVATKLMTIFLLPLYFTKDYPKRAVLFMTIGLLLVLLKREFLPWYFLWVLPMISLYKPRTETILFVIALSMGLLLQYAPVFWFGNYNPPVELIQNFVLFFLVLLVLINILLFKKRPFVWIDEQNSL